MHLVINYNEHHCGYQTITLLFHDYSTQIVYTSIVTLFHPVLRIQPVSIMHHITIRLLFFNRIISNAMYTKMGCQQKQNNSNTISLK